MHQSVLLHEVLNGLSVKPVETVLDATVGNAGHALYFCKAAGKKGTIVGIDLDHRALQEARKRLSGCPCKKLLLKENFRNLSKALREHGIYAIDKAFFDFGLRLEQIEQSGRGFSVHRDEPLLMTFDDDPVSPALTAYEIVNRWREKDIVQAIRVFGEESLLRARAIASGIVNARKNKPIERTSELVAIIEQNVPARFRRGRLHTARKTFQALRIVVNDEIAALEEGLGSAFSMLSSGGRIAAISFHSLEDRVVKKFFRRQAQEENGLLVFKKPIVPSVDEVARNPRSRSAKLRVLQKI